MGWTYNTPDDVANDGPQISAIAIAFTILSLSILALRLYVRVWMVKAVGAGELFPLHFVNRVAILTLSPDDYVLIFTWVSK